MDSTYTNSDKMEYSVAKKQGLRNQFRRPAAIFYIFPPLMLMLFKCSERVQVQSQMIIENNNFSYI